MKRFVQKISYLYMYTVFDVFDLSQIQYTCSDLVQFKESARLCNVFDGTVNAVVKQGTMQGPWTSC